jgi:hypothetical protein
MWYGTAATVPGGWQIILGSDEFLRSVASEPLGTGTFGGSGSTYSYKEIMVIERIA